MTAELFVSRLAALHADAVRDKSGTQVTAGSGDDRDDGEDDQFLDVTMGQIFALSEEFIDLPPVAIERLLESPVHRVRVGGVSTMNKQARRKKTPEGRRTELYDLYLRRHGRIDTWDLVDLGAPFVIGCYLFEFAKPHDILYWLARSEDVWERRTAITSTDYFIRKGDLDDTFALAEILLHDSSDSINKPVGSWLRAAGAKDRPRLLAFLDRHATTMPRVTLRFAIEHLDQDARAHYLGLKAATAP